MDWFRKHTDAFMVIGTILGAMAWMSGRFNNIEKDIAVIKAVMIMKNIMPTELAKGE